MCGSYELKTTANELVRHFRQLAFGQPDMPRGNEMRPAAQVLMLSGNCKASCARQARWGLVGHFLAAVPALPLMTLGCEGLVCKPFYSKILQKNRCLIPATAFFEWQAQLGGGGKKRIRFSHARGKPMLFAGIFDQHPVAGVTCAILTRQADHAVQAVNGRMPMILNPDEYAFWLDDYAEFPGDEFEMLMQSASRCPLKAELVPEPEVSPQLSFAFA